MLHVPKSVTACSFTVPAHWCTKGTCSISEPRERPQCLHVLQHYTVVWVWKITYKLPNDNIPEWETIFTDEKHQLFKLNKLLDPQMFKPKLKNYKTKKGNTNTSPSFITARDAKRELMRMHRTYNSEWLPRPSCIRMTACTRPMQYRLQRKQEAPNHRLHKPSWGSSSHTLLCTQLWRRHFQCDINQGTKEQCTATTWPYKTKKYAFGIWKTNCETLGVRLI